MRNPRLDGLRGIAILLVYAQHYLVQGWSAPSGSVLWWAARVSSSGWVGVDLFFGLSGFLIAGILLDHRASPRLLPTFFVRRAFRILPVYALLLVSFWLLPRVVDTSHLNLFLDSVPGWSYAVFLQNLFMVRGGYGPDWLGPTWSLAMEEQFYLVFPFVVLALPRRGLGAVLIAVLAAFPIVRWWHPVPFPLAFPWRGDALMAGALVALLVRRPDIVAAARRRLTPLAVLALALMLVLFATGRRPVGPLYGTCFSLATGLLIFLSAIGEGAAPLRFLESRFLGWLGRLSYGFYLIHVPVMIAMFRLVLGRAVTLATASDVAALVAATLISLGLAEASRILLEEPLIRRSHRRRYEDVPSPAPTTTPIRPSAGA